MQINMFDKIRIMTTKHINWVSSPANTVPTPHGVWTVVGILGLDLLVSKQICMCRVPISDIQLLEQQNG